MSEEKTEIPATSAEAMALFKRVDTKNPSATDITILRTMLQRQPQVWREAGDLLAQARKSYIALLSPSALRKETLLFTIQEMKKELSREHDTVLERLLIDQVIFCWLRLSVIEDQYSNVMRKPHSDATGKYWERRLTAAHKRHLSACESLARVRKLLRPSLRNLNIAVVNARPEDDSPTRRRIT